MSLEPPLQPLTGEIIDVRVFHPNEPSYCNPHVPSLYRRHEAQKKREYGDRVGEVERASFTPLVFATTGGMGREAIVFYRRLADRVSLFSPYFITLQNLDKKR